MIENSKNFSFFKRPIWNPFPEKIITLDDAYQYMISDIAKEQTEELRSIQDRVQARKFKERNFDYCTFSGVFEKRCEEKLIQHSGLMCIDFDHVEDVEGLIEKLILENFIETKILMRSPSGDGVKWIVGADLEKCSHRDYFNCILNYVEHKYGIKADRSGCDIARPCFLCYDPNAYINPKYKRNGKSQLRC